MQAGSFSLFLSLSRCAGAMLPDVMQTQSRAHAGFCRNGAVLLPGGSGEDSKVRQAIRRSYQRDHLLRALSGRRDIHLIRSHVIPTGTIQYRNTTMPEVGTIKRQRDVHSAIFINENPFT